jgi:hypothetical protein
LRRSSSGCSVRSWRTRGGRSAMTSWKICEVVVHWLFVRVLASSWFDPLRSLAFFARSSWTVHTQVSGGPWCGGQSASPEQTVRASWIFRGASVRSGRNFEMVRALPSNGLPGPTQTVHPRLSVGAPQTALSPLLL